MVLTWSTQSLKGKAWWEKLTLGYWLQLKYSNQLQGEAASLKGAWSFAVLRFWNYNETFIGYYLMTNLACWSIFYLSLSKLVLSTLFGIATPCKHHGKAAFSLYIPQVGWERNVQLKPLQSDGQHTIIQTMKKVLRTNYSFLPYLESLFHEAGMLIQYWWVNRLCTKQVCLVLTAFSCSLETSHPKLTWHGST